MGYALEDSKVRVDRFKERGKWYDTIVVDMKDDYRSASIHDSLQTRLREAGYSMDGWIYVCLEPYHMHSHPVMLKGRLS